MSPLFSQQIPIGGYACKFQFCSANYAEQVRLLLALPPVHHPPPRSEFWVVPWFECQERGDMQLWDSFSALCVWHPHPPPLNTTTTLIEGRKESDEKMRDKVAGLMHGKKVGIDGYGLPDVTFLEPLRAIGFGWSAMSCPRPCVSYTVGDWALSRVPVSETAPEARGMKASPIFP